MSRTMTITDKSGIKRTIREYDPMFVNGHKVRFHSVPEDFDTYGLFYVCDYDTGKQMLGNVLVHEAEFLTGRF